MKKNLKYYLSLNYPIEIRKIKKEEGGGYQASIPMLGKYAFVGDGDTIEEALADLEEVKKYLFKKYLDEGIPIPEPSEDEIQQFSGKFVLRIPSELHRFLASKAKENNTTLNQYCLYLLTRKSFLQSIQEEVSEIRSELKNLFCRVQEIYYKIEPPKFHPKTSTNVWDFKDYKKSA